MRIHRISLRDFRGVPAVDVRFDPAGVTVVEGRNEVGKTSIADAFALLLDEKDSSGKRQLRNVQPVGRDVGPFVEAELAVGPYRLAYRKQWLKARKTELQIFEPQPEQLSGESAHARMLEILDGHTDPVLFGALRYQQGIAISQAALAGSSSLLAALDSAAGGTQAGAPTEQEALLERVEKERLRYFTEKGGLPAARKEKAERLTELQQAVAADRLRISDLEGTAERHERVEMELGELRAQSPSVENQISELSASVRAIDQLERRVEHAEHGHDRAGSVLREAEVARDARKRLILSVGAASEALAGIEREIVANEPALAAAKRAVADAAEAHADAKQLLEYAEQEHACRKRVLELFARRLECDQLDERHRRVATADEAIETAELFLAGCAVDEKLVSKIDATANALAVAKGRAEGGRPRLSLEALRPVDVTLDGEQIEAVPGSLIERVVMARMELIMGDLARLVVSPPAAGDAEHALAEARQQLEGLLGEGGAASQEDAHAMVRERSHQEAERRSAVQRRADALRDLEPAQLAAKLARAQQRVGVLEAEIKGSAEGIDSLEDARAMDRRAEADLLEARSLEEERQTALTAVQASLRLLEDNDIEQRTRLGGAEAEAKRAAEDLMQAREQAPDDDLMKSVAAAEARLDEAARERKAAAESLAAEDPQSARVMLENAWEAQKGLRRKSRRARSRLPRRARSWRWPGAKGLPIASPKRRRDWWILSARSPPRTAAQLQCSACTQCFSRRESRRSAHTSVPSARR